MANKFTKSVLERQAKEMRQHPGPRGKARRGRGDPRAGSAGGGDRRNPCGAAGGGSGSRAQSGRNRPPSSPRPARAPPGSPGPAAPPVDLTEFIVRDEGRMAKNKTFYLDAAVIDALHRAAVAQKVTDSKLVNDILRKILGL